MSDAKSHFLFIVWFVMEELILSPLRHPSDRFAEKILAIRQIWGFLIQAEKNIFIEYIYFFHEKNLRRATRRAIAVRSFVVVVCMTHTEFVAYIFFCLCSSLCWSLLWSLLKSFSSEAKKWSFFFRVDIICEEENEIKKNLFLSFRFSSAH